MKRLLLAVALPLWLAAPLLAQDQTKPERIRYSTKWVAAEPLSDLNGELPKKGEEASVAREDIILAARLIPDQVAVLSAAVVDAKGKSLGDEGQPLFSLETSSGRVFCTSSTYKKSGFDSLFKGGPESKHVCFVDVDEDGAFESYFKKSSLVKALPNFNGRTSKKPKAISTTRYSTQAGKEWAEFLFVAFEYRGNANPRGNHVFQTIFGNADQRDNLTNRLVVKAKDLPKSVSFLGGSFELISGVKSVANVRVDETIQPVSFGVNRTVEIRTY